MPRELPENIKKPLAAIRDHKLRMSEFGQWLTDVIEQTEEELRRNGAYVSMAVLGRDDTALLSWSKQDDNKWALTFHWVESVSAKDGPRFGGGIKALACDLDDKTIVVGMLPELLEDIASAVAAQRYEAEEFARDLQLPEGQ